MIIFSDATKYDYIILHNIIKNVMSILVGVEPHEINHGQIAASYLNKDFFISIF